MSDHYENEREYFNMNKKSYDEPRIINETVKDVLTYPQTAWPDRGITLQTIQFFGVRMKLNQLTREIDAIYFPYMDETNKTVGFKKRDLTLHKKEKFHFSVVGYVGTEVQLFGQHKCKSKAKRVFITEGEIDTLACHQAYMQNTGEDFKQYGVNVVSIGCGTKNAVEHIANNEHFLKGFEQIVLCFDNDEITERERLKKKDPGMRGKEATAAVGVFLRDHLVHRMKWEKYNTLPSGKFPKDAADFLRPENNKPKWLYSGMNSNTEEYKSKKIVGLYDVFNKGECFKPIDRGVYLNSFPKLMDKLLGIRQKEATLVLAPSGAGKTSLCAELAYEVAEERGGVGGIFLEEGMLKTGKRFIARKLKIHPNLFKFRDDSKDDVQKFSDAEDWVADKDRFLFLDHYGSIAIDELVDLCKVMIYKHNRKFIVFDHISLAVDEDGTIQERAALTIAMKAITTLCEACDVHIMVVAHINRNATTVKANDREIEKPIWKRTFITDGKGTQALEALAHNIITVDIELLPDGTRGRIRLFLGKNREADSLGFCDITRMDEQTGIFYDASEEYWTDCSAVSSY